APSPTRAARLHRARPAPHPPPAMPPRWRPILSRIDPYIPPPPLARLEAELGRPVIRLSANENPIGPSPRAVEAIRAEAGRIHLYPDGGAPALREAVAAALGVTPAHLLFGNGGGEIPTLLARALPEPRAHALPPRPCAAGAGRRGRRPGPALGALHDARPPGGRRRRQEPAPRLPDRPGRRPRPRAPTHEARLPLEPPQPDRPRLGAGGLGALRQP